MSNAVSLATRLQRAGMVPRGAKGAKVLHMRLAVPDEDDVRYVFCDWERDCGVQSNQTAQVNALIDRNFARTVERAEQTLRRDIETGRFLRATEDTAGLRLGHAAPPKLPLADRGWPTLTAKPSKTVSAPIRLDHRFAPEKWTLKHEGIGRPKASGYLSFRERVIVAFRTLSLMGDRGQGRHVVVLYRLFGPAVATPFVRLRPTSAPIAHLTPKALDLAAQATIAMRETRAELHALERVSRRERAQEIRIGIIDRATRSARRGGITPDEVGFYETVLSELEQLERSTGENADAWARARAAADRATVEPRQALEDAFRRASHADRQTLVTAIEKQAETMTVRAVNAYYDARAEVLQ